LPLSPIWTFTVNGIRNHRKRRIVGSGAGGAAAAYRLVSAGLNVLMLEKGDPLPQTEDGSHPDNRVFERADHGTETRSESRPPLRVMDYDATRTPASQREHQAFTRAFQRDLLRIGFLSFTQRVGLNGTAHVDGTLVAGNDSSDAVVDLNGAVFGIAGLYVVDGSILPRSSRVNPSLSIYAWGLRVADLLAKSLRPEHEGTKQ
jgi:choline dehydrogenase-like flavoprotein